jgi:hypothetical protein
MQLRCGTERGAHGVDRGDAERLLLWRPRRRARGRWSDARTESSAPLSGRRFRSAIVRALQSRASYRVRASSDVCDSR